MDPFSKGGCISNVMEIPEGVCFSTFQPNWKSLKEISNGPGPDLTGTSKLAKLDLVSLYSSDASRQTHFDSTSRSFNGPKDGKAYAAELITSAKRQGSIPHYESVWGKWNSRCSRKQVDPISDLLNLIF